MRPIAERTQQLAGLHEQIFGPQVAAANLPAAGELPSFVDARDSELNTAFTADDLPRTVTHLTDAELLDKARNAANGAKFQRLWSGDLTDYGSHSEADLALCCHLAFWTQNNAARIDAMFRRSGLYRAKWDQRRGGSTYGERTIQRAIASTTATYEPGVEIPALPLEPGAAPPIDVEKANLENF